MRTRWSSVVFVAGLVLAISGFAGMMIGPRAALADTTGCTTSTNLVGCNVVNASAGTFVFRVENQSPSNGSSAIAVRASGTSGTTNGIFSRNDSSAGTAVYGQAIASGGTAVRGDAIAPSGTTYGVYGQSASPTGYGVFGTNTSSAQYTVALYGSLGTQQAPDGVAVYGRNLNPSTSAHYYGVQGYTLTNFGVSVQGVNASTTTGIGVEGIGGIGVRGYSNNPNGNYAGRFDGNVSISGTCTGCGGGGLLMDHPLDQANKYLAHAGVVSPDMLDIYNGNVTTDAKGTAVVALPSYFEALNRDFRYQLTVVGQFAQAIVASEIKNNQFTIKTDKPTVKVSWQVTGIRNDPYTQAHRIQVEQAKPSQERGQYLHPKELGQPETQGIGYEQRRLATAPRP